MSVEFYTKGKKLQFNYGDEVIQFEWIQRPRAKQSVLIKVHHDCHIQALSPVDSSAEDVITAVQQKVRWVYRQIKHFREQRAFTTPRQYVSGESHYYLGKQYMLKVLHQPDEPESVKLLRGKLEVSLKKPDPSRVRDLLQAWYKSKAKDIFAQRLEKLLPQALWVEQAPPIRVLTMQKQWGNCSPQGRLTLNPLLVKVPSICIDYVILHELCHIAEHNHSPRFYRLLTSVMPNWEKVKDQLESMVSKVGW